MFTEDQIKFLVKDVIAPCIMESNNKMMEITSDYQRQYAETISNVMIKQMKQDRYENQRNMLFIKAVLFQQNFSNEECYVKYCEEFDKLNKDKLE